MHTVDRGTRLQTASDRADMLLAFHDNNVGVYDSDESVPADRIRDGDHRLLSLHHKSCDSCKQHTSEHIQTVPRHRFRHGAVRNALLVSAGSLACS